MITRLQDEKAAMQMEALHYQRMMEEQAEYDSEALAKANELLAQREQQIEELKAELENYRTQFAGGPTEKQSNQVSFKEENTAETVLDESNLEVPVITTPSGKNSLMWMMTHYNGKKAQERDRNPFSWLKKLSLQQ
ncbi:hypothetical protein E2562_016906 [Oryza meyeriana var. granulata]|uniref:GTD-binding domain-containing protein n=1 Tax=Oryza meyeriana var. granulata TaxID=110450 RepID=A0A6G1DX75_9ORYZ|nr:hypothetical protein E2562_016906 [Oryza meyeriana var. granulata]